MTAGIAPRVCYVNAGGCTGCLLELYACAGPRFDLEQFGIEWVVWPEAANILLVSGPLLPHNLEYLRRVHESVPKPRRLVAFGTCAMSGGIYLERENSDVIGPLKKGLQVDWKIPGCPPRPEVIIEGILKVSTETF